MKRWIAVIASVTGLAGCVTLESLPSLSLLHSSDAMWGTSLGGRDVAIIAIASPDMCVRAIETRSDVALIRPDYQNVIDQSCNRWDGMGDAAVVWVAVPRPQNADAEESSVRVAQEAYQRFAFDKAKLGKPSQTLSQLLKTALAKPETAIRIVGHTDSIGSSDYNKDLGKRRANAVAQWLIANGIDRSRIQTFSEGEGSPVADNRTSKGRSDNRRAQSQILLMIAGG